MHGHRRLLPQRLHPLTCAVCLMLAGTASPVLADARSGIELPPMPDAAARRARDLNLMTAVNGPTATGKAAPPGPDRVTSKSVR